MCGVITKKCENKETTYRCDRWFDFFYKAKAVEANEWYPIITPFSFKAFSSLEIEVYISPLYPTDDNFWQKKKAYSSITFILAGKTTLDKPESSNAFCVIN